MRWPDEPLGPVRQAVSDELERLGFSPLTEPGPLRTAAERALSLAEVYDHTGNAAALPPLDRQLANVMDEARRCSQPSVLVDPGTADAEVSDFEERRRRREEGA